MDKRKITLTVIGVAVLLVVLVGSTYAYWTANTENKISTNTTIQTGTLKLVLNDGTNKDGVLSGTIDPNNTKFTTYLSITNEGTYDTFAKLYFKGLTNTFSNDLVYSIEEVDSIPTGNTEPKIVKRFKYQVPVPSTETSSRELLADGLLIKMGTLNGNNLIPNTQYYRVTIEYLYSDTVNQSSDMGKQFYTGFDIEQGDKLTETIVMLDNIEDLVELANEVNTGDNKSGKEYRLMRNLDFNSDDSYLDAATTKYGDINKNGTIESIKTELTTEAGWTPIGTESNPFSGTFNGQNNELSHLYINNNDTTLTELGLFGVVNNGAINNLGMRDENLASSTSANIGGIIGNFNNGTMNNCYNTITSGNGNINIKHSQNNYSIGGLIGNSSEGNINVSDSYNKSNLSGAYLGGGIVGSILQGNSNINNCYNEGIMANSSANSGIVGNVSGNGTRLNIYRSYNSGSIHDCSICGGIVGLANNYAVLTLNECINNANISSLNGTGKTNGWANASGLVSTNGYSAKTYIINSANYGNVTYNTSSVNNENSVGGLIGYTGAGYVSGATIAYISNSFNMGNVTATTGISKAGIIGRQKHTSPVLNIYNVYNFGDVSSSGNNYGILYNEEGTTNVSKAYYKTPNAFINTNSIGAANVSIAATGMSLTQMQDSSFVTTLNNNRSSITLPSELSGYTLSTWCTSDNGPVLDYQVPESERATRCPAYNN